MTSGHELTGLIKFLEREAWSEPFAEVLNAHLGAALDEFDLDLDELGEVLGDAWVLTLWGCAFEDFLTRTLEPDGRNIVEDYLRRRGFKETARTKAYIRALRTSVMSLYEVSEIQPGQSLLARDLVRGGEPIRVQERTATRTLKPWDQIAARIVRVGDGHVFAGGLLPYAPEASERLLGNLHAASGGARTDGAALLDDDRLCAAAPLLTNTWLFDVLAKALNPTPPIIVNSDGDAVAFHELRFPLAKGVRRGAIIAQLGTCAALQPESEVFWTWLGDPSSLSKPHPDATYDAAWEVTVEDGRTVLGSVELRGRELALTVNASARAVRGTAILRDLLGPSLLEPTTIVRTVEELRDAPGNQGTDVPEIPVEIATPLVHEMLDRRYRQTLDEPVPVLGGVSPREAVKTADGRNKVVDWLKHLENQSVGSRDPTDPMATYDLSWLWRELGIATLRR